MKMGRKLAAGAAAFFILAQRVNDETGRRPDLNEIDSNDKKN